MSVIQLVLTDSTGSLTLPLLSPPLTTTTVEGASDIQTLDNNVSTYFTQNKRQWSHEWPFLTEDEYNNLVGYYDRQWTTYEYPLLSLAYFGISNVPVRMYLEQKNVIDNCGTVEDVAVTFRETRQLS